MTSGVIRDAGAPEELRVVSVGRPSWWVMAVAVAALVPVIILARVERQAKRAAVPETVPAGAVPALGGSR